jgi:hypothetical protein
MINKQFIYNQNIIHIQLLVARSKTYYIVFAKLSLSFVINVSKLHIYHNYTKLLCKSNLNIHSFYLTYCSNETNETFFKGLNIHNKETYKIPNHLKEIIFEFCHLIATHNVKIIMIWLVATIFYAKKVMENIKKCIFFILFIYNQIGINNSILNYKTIGTILYFT